MKLSRGFSIGLLLLAVLTAFSSCRIPTPPLMEEQPSFETPKSTAGSFSCPF